MEKVRVIEDPATSVLKTVYHNFSTGKWRWIRGESRRGRNGYCLIGAINAVNSTRSVKGAAKNRLLAAVKRTRAHTRNVSSIPAFNDSRRSKDSILAVLEDAIGEEVVK